MIGGSIARLGAAAILAVGISQSAYAQDAQPNCLYNKAGPAVAHIVFSYTTTDNEKTTSRGSGVVVTPQGDLLTSLHVVQPKVPGVAIASSSMVAHLGSRAAAGLPLTMVASDPENDLALLRLPPALGNAGWTPADISAANELAVGARLTALGFGAGGDLAFVGPGLKTADRTLVDGKERPWWQTNLPLNEGNSGGPVFGELGTVVGIAVAKRIGAEAVSFVIPISRATNVLTNAKVSPVPYAACAEFPACQAPEHGIQRYAFDKPMTGIPGQGAWSSCSPHGKNSESKHCDSREAGIKRYYPDAVIYSRKGERRECSDGNLQYRCELQVQHMPEYKVAKSAICLRPPAN
jgi:S1-C subfamily serine protease